MTSDDMFFMLGVLPMTWVIDYLYVMITTAARALSRDRDQQEIVTQITCRWLARVVLRLCRTPERDDVERGNHLPQPVSSSPHNDVLTTTYAFRTGSSTAILNPFPTRGPSCGIRVMKM
jgi:hypothetical protein